ncbi:MAG: dihydroorotate dehydrogenase electron transfer subunit [Gammaproteobacteria bacterium]|nr:dihydroorotate dehydrogenase electron transfer subunit [Gammaproteobacteria bacterium]
MSQPDQRGTICLEDAPVVSQTVFPGDQFLLRVSAPRCAARATPGTFAHLTCDPLIPMRRPLSIMRADAQAGWLEFLYKPVGPGLERLAKRATDEVISVLAPIGRGFTPDPERPVVLAVAGGVGIPPVHFLAESLRTDSRFKLIVLMGSEVPFPFELTTRSMPLPGVPDSASMAVAQLEAWDTPSALASKAGFDGCFDGFVPGLAREWLANQPPDSLSEVQIVSCGPHVMLEATASLAREFGLPCQIAVEEFMACGVGGCAGCIVPLHKPDGIVMKRVCVDGPVFDAAEVFPG